MQRRVRPRPVDPFRRMYISGEPGGVYDEEEEGEGGTAAKRITLVDLPIPEVTEVAAYAGEHTPDFVQPLSYIKFPIRLAEFDDGELEYDLDHEDEVWLDSSRWGSRAETRNRMTPQKLEELIDRLEKESGKLGNSGELSTANAIRIARERLNISNAHVVEDVYKYWINKRNKLKKPLLRRLWPPTSALDTNPHNVFRPRDKGRYNTRRQRKNDTEGYVKLGQLREDFVAARGLLAAVKQRERLKLEHARLFVDVFEQEMYDLTNTTALSRVSGFVTRMDEVRTLYPETRVFPVRTPAPYDPSEYIRMRAESMAEAEEATVQPPKMKPAAVPAAPSVKKDKQKRPAAASAPKPLVVNRPNIFRAAGDGSDPMELSSALGLRSGVVPTESTLFAHRLGKLDAGAVVGKAAASNSARSWGRLGAIDTSVWEGTGTLVPGIGGYGPHGEGWELMGVRPEARPPHINEINPDLDIVYAIRCHRAERLMASNSNIPRDQLNMAKHSSPLRRMSIDGGALAAAAAATAAHGGPVDPTHTGGEASHGSAGDKHAAHTDKHVTIQEDPSANRQGHTRPRARTASVSAETAEALASALAGSSRDIGVSLEELVHSDSDDSSDEEASDADAHVKHKRRASGDEFPEYYWVPITPETSHLRAAAWAQLAARAKRREAAPQPAPTSISNGDTDLFDVSGYETSGYEGPPGDASPPDRLSVPWLAHRRDWRVSLPHWAPHAGLVTPPVVPGPYNVTTMGVYRERERRPQDRGILLDTKDDAATRIISDWYSAEFPMSDIRPHASDAVYGFI